MYIVPFSNYIMMESLLVNNLSLQECNLIFKYYRIVGLRPVFTKQALLNRQNPKIYNVFVNILGEKVRFYRLDYLHWSYTSHQTTEFMLYTNKFTGTDGQP